MYIYFLAKAIAFSYEIKKNTLRETIKYSKIVLHIPTKTSTWCIGSTAILSVTQIDWTVALLLTQAPKIPEGAGCITVQAMSTKWTL